VQHSGVRRDIAEECAEIGEGLAGELNLAAGSTVTVEPRGSGSAGESGSSEDEYANQARQ